MKTFTVNKSAVVNEIASILNGFVERAGRPGVTEQVYSEGIAAIAALMDLQFRLGAFGGKDPAATRDQRTREWIVALKRSYVNSPAAPVVADAIGGAA